jgi:hypothetical protein
MSTPRHLKTRRHPSSGDNPETPRLLAAFSARPEDQPWTRRLLQVRRSAFQYIHRDSSDKQVEQWHAGTGSDTQLVVDTDDYNDSG